VEITGGRQSDTEQRRQATASKIVIGREEIDKFGDATVGEVLRRLPGVSAPGAPGRGGPPRLRGLGAGFTQLLIDGQRVAPGFSLESLTPEQVERIEILRAPTAETGARAIAGTINIITREGFRRRLNDLRIGAGLENGQWSNGLNWTHNDSAGDLTYNLSGSLFRRSSDDEGRSQTTVTRIADGAVLEQRSGTSLTESKRIGANLTARLQWRLNESGDSLMLMPSVFHTENDNQGLFTQTLGVVRPETTARFDRADSAGEGAFTAARLGLQWRQRLGDVRMEANGNANLSRGRNDSLRREFGGVNRVIEDSSRSRDRTLSLALKGTQLIGGNPEVPGSESTVVAGAEVESVDRRETRSNLENGRPTLTDFGDNLQASSLRLAAYAQNEWTINPHWSAYAGLRWEGITTEGDSADGNKPRNRSSVWTPLAHAVYKPDPKGRDQVRISLTRSYRSPPLQALIARPSINRDRPTSGPNEVDTPDSAGNPALKPELATGVDIAFERYLASGGVLSANVFRRNISNLIRSRTELEAVSYSPFERFVRRQRNIGSAITQGVELEAKFRLDQLIEGSAPVELRANLSVFDSKVRDVPGPDNRLEQQAQATANFGADYRLRGTPLTLGGNVNYVPGYSTRLDEKQTVNFSRKQVWDAYALWTFNPATALRLLASNLAAEDYETGSINEIVSRAGVAERSTSVNVSPSYINWQLRLELKL
jgi:iron complex outermembrane receptor protein